MITKIKLESFLPSFYMSGNFSYLTEVLKKCGEIFTAYVCAGFCQLMIKSYRKQKRIESNTCILYILHHVYERISFICGLIIASTSLTSVFVCQASWCQNDQDLLHWANSQTTCSVSVMVQVFIKINFLWKTFKYEGKMIAKIWVEIFRSC